MEWKDVLPDIAKLAPTVGSLFGAPGIAGGAIVSGLVSLVTGTNDPQQALQTLQADPAKIAELENHAKDVALQHYQAQLTDTANARGTMVSLAGAHSAIAWGPVVISAVILLGFFIVIDLMFFVKTSFNENQASLLNQLFGALIVMANSVVQFWVGSSRGSQVKDFYMANSQPVQSGNVLPWKKVT